MPKKLLTIIILIMLPATVYALTADEVNERLDATVGAAVIILVASFGFIWGQIRASRQEFKSSLESNTKLLKEAIDELKKSDNYTMSIIRTYRDECMDGINNTRKEFNDRLNHSYGTVGKELKDHQVNVAENYVTDEKLEKTIDRSLKPLMISIDNMHRDLKQIDALAQLVSKLVSEMERGNK